MKRAMITGKRGFALVVTLVVTTLMVAVTVELIHQVYVDTSLSRGFRDGQQASLLAESGLIGGVKLLQLVLSSHPGYTSLSDEWAKPFKLDDETGSITITTTEESGLINLNFVPNQIEFNEKTLATLKRLGRGLKVQVPEECWSSLADWMDANDETRSGGAENTHYLTQVPPYRAANRPLMSLSELSLVKGFLPEHLAALRPLVTIYSSGLITPVNINTASKEVIIALDDRIDERMADRIDEQRRLQPFKNTGDLETRVPGLAAIAAGLGGSISFEGTVFRIKSEARVKETVRTVEAVVRLGGAPQFLSWQEY